MDWLSKRWLLSAAAATLLLVVLGIAFELAGLDTNIDTGNNLAKGIFLAVLVISVAAWCGVVLHALRVMARHSRSRR